MKKSLYKLNLFLSDIHYPYANEKLLEAIFHLISNYRWQRIIQLGDLCDCYAISNYSKNPERLLGFKDEIESARKFWRRIRQLAPNAELIMKEGNHEERLTKELWKKPELHGLISMDKLLELDKVEALYYKASETLILDNCLSVTHGDVVSTNSGATAIKEMSRRMTCGVSGHVHRAAHVCLTTQGTGALDWCEAGFLGTREFEGFDYAGDYHNNWQPAFVISQYIPAENRHNLNLIRCYNNSFVFNNQHYTPEGILNF